MILDCVVRSNKRTLLREDQTMAKKRNALRVILVIASVCPSLPAIADCAGVDAAVKAAPSQFQSLKGSRDPDGEGETYFSSLNFSPLNDCSVNVREDDRDVYVYCRAKKSSFYEAKDQAEDVAKQIESCLRARGPVQASDWKESRNDRTYMTFDSYSKSFVAPTSNQGHDVEFTIAGTCMTSKRRGSESCSTTLSVDLTDDT
jgi:hypothetical protein